MIDLFGHFAYAAVFLGMILLSRQSNAGWLVKAAGDGGWVAIGLVLGMSSIIVWGTFFVLLDLVGWAKWRKNDREELALVAERIRSGEPTVAAEEFFHNMREEARRSGCRKKYWHGPQASLVRCGTMSPELGYAWLCPDHYRSTTTR